MIDFISLGLKKVGNFTVSDTLHTHVVHQVEYEGKLWILKEIIQSSSYSEKRPVSAVVVELVSQNFYRMLLAQQPEYRLLTSGDASNPEYYLLSEYQWGFQCIPPYMGAAFESGRFRGLGQAVLIAMFLEETDLKNGNIGIVPHMDGSAHVVKLDGDYSLASYRPYRQIVEESICSAKIDMLPFPRQSRACSWLDLIKQYTSSIHSRLIDSSANKNPLIRDEINEAILKILLLNKQNLSDFINQTIAHSLAYDHEGLLEYFSKRQHELFCAILSNSSFLTYLDSSKAQVVMEEFSDYLQNFELNHQLLFDSTLSLSARFSNLRNFCRIYNSASRDASGVNRQLKAHLKQQTDLAFENNFEALEFEDSLRDYSLWHHEIKERLNELAPDFMLELMQAIYNRSIHDCLKNTPEVFLKRALQSDISAHLEILTLQQNAVVGELRARFEVSVTLVDFVNLYSDAWFVSNQLSSLLRLITTKFKKLECSHKDEEISTLFIKKAYLMSSLDFRKSLSVPEIFGHYLKLLVNQKITEISELEGKSIYDEIMKTINHNAEDSMEDDLLVLSDLLELKSKMTTPSVCRFREQLSSSDNEGERLNYFSLGLVQRLELFDKIHEDDCTTYSSRSMR